MIIDKMKILDHLTIQEKYLVDYIINNQEDILKKNINELAKLSYTSSATISRLCKKLGFNGYKEFKYQYAAEYSHLLELKNDFKIEPFSSESSIDDALNKIELLHKRAIEYTKSLLDRQVIERIYQLIKNAKYIEIYGTGINFSLAEIYSLNFEEEGVISKAYNSLNPMHLQYLKQRKPNDKYMDKLMLGGFSKIETGYYENVEKILTVALGFVTAFGNVMLPRMSNMVAKKDDMGVKKTIALSMRFVLGMSMAMAFGLSAIASDLVPVYFGKGFDECIVIMRVFVFSIIFQSWANVIRTQYLIPYIIR